MALERVYYLESRSQDSNIAIFKDATIYGAPEVNRSQEAHFIVIAKTNELQELIEFFAVDNTTPLTSLEFQITQSKDGSYILIAFNPAFWVNSVDYVVGTIVYNDGAFYKATAISGPATAVYEPGTTTDWENFWTATVDFTLEVSNPLVDKHIHKDVITFRFEDCLVEELDDLADDMFCSTCAPTEDMMKVLSMQLMLAATNSNNWQGKQFKSEVIITESNKKFCCA